MTVTLTNPFRRAVLVLLAVLTIATGLLGVHARRAEALAPGAPHMIGPVSWNHEILVAWAVPFTGGKDINQYEVERYIGNAAVASKTWNPAPNVLSLVDTGLMNEVTYKYRVRAHNVDGWSPWTAKYSVVPHAWNSDISPFDNSVQFIVRQYQDLLGRFPSGLEIGAAQEQLAEKRGSSVITHLAHDEQRVFERHPVIRLYFAFFKRTPDYGGANYWINKRKGGKNLNWIASSFAASSEFQNTYGALSNLDYVKKIYLNVFDRQPDPGGLAYWTNKLDTHQKTRGQVMVGFSESSEYAGNDDHNGRSTGRVEAADIYLALMKKAPTAGSMAVMYAPHIQAGGSQGVLAMRLLRDDDYPNS